MKELVQVVEQSDADFVILGGDFNADPKKNANETTIGDIRNIMVNSIEEFFQTIEVKKRANEMQNNAQIFLYVETVSMFFSFIQ